MLGFAAQWGTGLGWYGGFSVSLVCGKVASSRICIRCNVGVLNFHIIAGAGLAWGGRAVDRRGVGAIVLVRTRFSLGCGSGCFGDFQSSS